MLTVWKLRLGERKRLPCEPATGSLVVDGRRRLVGFQPLSLYREGGTFRETETRNAICLAFLNACDSAVAPLDDLAQLAELDLNGQRRDR